MTKKSGDLSRRKLLAQVSVTSLAGSVGASLFGTSSALANPRETVVEDDRLSGARVYNIRDFGAKGDGMTLDTVAVQSAIDAAHKDEGGTVIVPAGTFVVATIQLKSNVTLHAA